MIAAHPRQSCGSTPKAQKTQIGRIGLDRLFIAADGRRRNPEPA
jgi:hypothetical protein